MRSARRAFTILELLVSIAVLALLVVLVAQMTSDTAQSTAGSQKRSESAAQARMVFDRLALDLGRLVQRPDVDYEFGKANGNDFLRFYARTPGYSSDTTRTLSVVGYRIPSNSVTLERGARGVGWDDQAFTPFVADKQTQSLINGASLPNLDAGDWDTLGDRVLRFEVTFLVRGNPRPTITAPTSANDLLGLNVGVVLIDRTTAGRLTAGQLVGLANQFPDARDDITVGALWAPVAGDVEKLAQTAGVPVSAAAGIRVYQKFYRFRPAI